MINTEKIKYHIRGLLEALGDDPEREGLLDTPERVAKMYAEVFEGMNYTNDEIAGMFDKTFGFSGSGEEDPKGLKVDDDPDALEETNAVVLKDIGFFSYCEHHLALMYDMKATVAYIPRGRVIGLSKIVRIVEMVGKRLQLQERIGRDIADIMTKVTGSQDVAVLISGKHSCITARGIKNQNTVTETAELRGAFRTDPSLQFFLK